MSDVFVAILWGWIVWKYGKNAKKCESYPALAVKNEKMADFCGFASVFVPKRAFFYKKMPQSGAGVCCCYRLRVKSMNLARCARYWSISNAVAFCVVLNIGVNALLSCQVFCHSAKSYLTKNIISFGAAWA